MQEIIAQGLTYIWGIWRHKWLALAVAWLVAIAGWVHVWNMPESFVGRAKLYVDTNTVLRPLLRGLAITPDINQRVRLMSSTLFSRPNLEKLARMTDLDLQASTDSQKDALISRLRSTVSLSAQRGNSSMYNISVRHADRDTARRITQSLITVFIESSLNEKRNDSTGAQDFLDEQIADYERRLIESEGRLARFKQQNVGVLPGKGGDYYSRLEGVRENLKQAELELEEMRNRRDELDRQLHGEGGSLEDLIGSGAATPTEMRMRQLRVRLDSLLTRYTDKHPEVRQIKALMAELDTQREIELEAMRDGLSTEAISSSPLYQGMRSMLAEAEAGVAELEVRVAEYQRREAGLAKKVNQIPEIEAQLKQLDRDYGVVRKRHEELLKRRESVRLSQGVEDNASDVTFRVVDPPFVPRKPSDPDKTKLNTLVLVAALAAGAGIALLISLLRPIVVDARMLAEATELPLLGVVTFNKDSRTHRLDQLKFVAFTGCAGILMAAFAVVQIAPQLFERVGALA
ncbi:MAG: Wzz/FepE/Etk N-terminal domain-containing protein [Congregibacter sp.]